MTASSDYIETPDHRILQRIRDSQWTWYRPIGEFRSPGMEGKYLFFSKDYDALESIVLEQFDEGARCAKIRTNPPDGTYVLCLFDTNDGRTNDLDAQYEDRRGIQFRGWKSNQATHQGQYSKQYHQHVKPHQQRLT